MGRYTVARDLGSGGMGEVYLGYSPAGSPVAVKVIRTDRLDPHTRARFEKEALIARTVVGTNRVARFLDADPYADRPWMAMEYIPGRTLLNHVDQQGVLPPPSVASLGALLAEGLEAVHSAGLLHRDLKPQNIILGSDGPMIIDFGLGAFLDASQDSLSHSGMIVGSVRCMPPEQASGHPKVTPAADVYALGTVLLYAATGHYPYDGSRWEAIVAQVTSPHTEPDLSGVPSELAGLLAAMLAYEPGARPSLKNVAEECARLLAAAATTPAEARLALIARTTEADGVRSPTPPGSAPTEALVGADDPPGDTPDPGSPLDTPPAAAEAETTEATTPESGAGNESAAELPADEADPTAADEDTPSDRVPQTGSNASTRPRVPRPRAPRQSAPRRVARELRMAYAARPDL